MISVVIPTLDAARTLPSTLAALAEAMSSGVVKQVIVSDGGSVDETAAVAEAAGCEVLVGRKSRGRQLRAGAEAATGDWLLFLHADTALAPGWAEEAQRFMRARRAHHRAAFFRLDFDDASPAARRIVFWARLRARMLGLPYGDQGLLISRFLYQALGGFRDIPLMEDVDIVRRIGRRRLTELATCAVTSAEKYRHDGYDKRARRNLILLARFLLGADPAELAKIYD